METMKFRTNIKCSGCVAKVTPYLNEMLGDDKWEVNIEDPQKILTVKTAIDETKVNYALEQAGYQGKRI